ncbi:uncharacterized protein K489DRAFT_209235 [Dissoconium aciculare CBS 342.82]|uniref:Secreted protein n=1 Tax=Dissoconium aciculare CBS 342.82 TaxID=1314786 RepID=A0A6J3MAJ7_9PEZI|nr:uncharacterized protein K489DRAFT_209235 [Dissoconium aciculare CBS 342.82]KAF1823842.1 hypothetical protein K489DRAFT_209235 [Dissoconium aciculare CBS 342.82]
MAAGGTQLITVLWMVYVCTDGNSHSMEWSSRETDCRDIIRCKLAAGSSSSWHMSFLNAATMHHYCTRVELLWVFHSQDRFSGAVAGLPAWASDCRTTHIVRYFAGSKDFRTVLANAISPWSLYITLDI